MSGPSDFKLDIPPKAQLRADKVFASMDDQKNVLLEKLKSFPAAPLTESCNSTYTAQVSADQAFALAKSAFQAQDYATVNLLEPHRRPCWEIGNGAASYGFALYPRSRSRTGLRTGPFLVQMGGPLWK